jgi:L-fuculose-phosphate aldolase
LADAVANTIGDSYACLMKNHGMIACGKNVASAFSLASNCEWVAEIQWRCLCCGTPNILNDAEMAKVLHKFQSYGQAPEKK